MPRYDGRTMRWLLLVAACSATPSPAPLQATAPPPPPAACPAPTQEIKALVAQLDVDGDPLHSDLTPAVMALAEHDIAGGCAVLEALDAPDMMTRLHASRVLESIVSTRFGFRPGRGFRDQYAEEHARALLRSIGYAYDGGARRPAIERWRAWLAHPIEPAADGPSRGEIAAALAAVRPALTACGEPLDVMVEFDRSGKVSSIWGTDRADAQYRQCLAVAVQGVAVHPFARASLWTHYPW